MDSKTGNIVNSVNIDIKFSKSSSEALSVKNDQFQVSYDPTTRVISCQNLRGDKIWSREESLASPSSVVFATIVGDHKPDNKDLQWLIGPARLMVSLSREASRIVGLDVTNGRTVWAISVPSDVTRLVLSDFHESIIELRRDDGTVYGTLNANSGLVDVGASHPVPNTSTYTINKRTGQIFCQNKWSLNLHGRVLAEASSLHTEQGTVPVLVKGDASVVFKYMNPNMVALVTERPSGVALTGIDSVTGSIFFQAMIPEADASSPIHVVACDNWIVGHYYNIKANRFEVIAVDFFEKKEDKGVYAILTGQDKSTSHKSAFQLPIDPIVLMQQYIFPLGPVTAISVTSTLKGVTPRQVLFATNNGILSMRKDTWLNPRRPGGDIPPRLAISPEESLPPYSHTLPVIWTDFINHMHKVENVTRIESFPTHLESTSVIVAIGQDIFISPVYIGNAPYDVLSPFFNYWLLYVSVCVVVGGVIVTSVLAKRRELFNKWK
jgi:outer membrane protein assembly factor BamB